MKRLLFVTLALTLLPLGTARAGIILYEGFDDISSLGAAGWAAVNNSAPLGLTDWFQGNPGVFPAYSGAENSYIAANFENAGPGGNISNWGFTPVITFEEGTTLLFRTRTESPAVFADRLELRLSLNGASTDVGTSDVSVGDFGLLLMTINPALDPGGYPDGWTQVGVVLYGVGGASGRFGFRYFVPDTFSNGNYIGIDDVEISTPDRPVVPEPTTIALVATGLAGFVARRRRGAR